MIGYRQSSYFSPGRNSELPVNPSPRLSVWKFVAQAIKSGKPGVTGARGAVEVEFRVGCLGGHLPISGHVMLRLSPLPWRFSCYKVAILIAIAVPSPILMLIVIVVCRLFCVKSFALHRVHGEKLNKKGSNRVELTFYNDFLQLNPLFNFNFRYITF